MKTQTYMTVRMCSLLLTAAVPMMGVVAAARQRISVDTARSRQATSHAPCDVLANVASNRNSNPRVDVLDVAPSHKPDCR